MLVFLQLFSALVGRVKLKPKSYCSILDIAFSRSPGLPCRAVISKWLRGSVFRTSKPSRCFACRVSPANPKPFNPSKSPFNPEIRPFNVSYFTCRIRPCYRSPCTQLPPSAASPLTLLALLCRCTYRGPAAGPRSLGVPLSISLCRLFVFILLRIASPANPLYSHPYKSPGGDDPSLPAPHSVMQSRVRVNSFAANSLQPLWRSEKSKATHFQSLAASFYKTPGVGGASTLGSADGSMPRTRVRDPQRGLRAHIQLSLLQAQGSRPMDEATKLAPFPLMGDADPVPASLFASYPEQANTLSLLYEVSREIT